MTDERLAELTALAASLGKKEWLGPVVVELLAEVRRLRSDNAGLARVAIRGEAARAALADCQEGIVR